MLAYQKRQRNVDVVCDVFIVWSCKTISIIFRIVFKYSIVLFKIVKLRVTKRNAHEWPHIKDLTSEDI